jgi:ribosome-binding factor A
MTRRNERVNHTLQRELGALIAGELKDPRLPNMTSVTAVVCSGDLREAQVSVSVLGTAEEREQALAALESAAGMLRHALAGRVRMRHIPRLQFRTDATIEKASGMLKLMDQVAAEDRARAAQRTSPHAASSDDSAESGDSGEASKD